MNADQPTEMLLKHLREVDRCIAELSELASSASVDPQHLRQREAELDEFRHQAFEKLENYFVEHGADLNALPPTRSLTVAKELLGAALKVRKVRLRTDARSGWDSEFYWDLYYIESRLAYASIRELDPEAAERQHM